jgi:hypothetical protein
VDSTVKFFKKKTCNFNVKERILVGLSINKEKKISLSYLINDEDAQNVVHIEQNYKRALLPILYVLTVYCKYFLCYSVCRIVNLFHFVM